MADKLKIDPEFEALCPPLGPEEFNLLETGIINDGCRDAIIAWRHDGEELVIDGHHRYRICRSAGSGFKVTYMPFESRAHVIDWIVRNQLGRRNCSEEQKAYLRGKRYGAEKKIITNPNGRKPRPVDGAQSGHHQKTSEKLAAEFEVAPNTIRRNERFANAVDKLAIAGGEQARRNVLSGEVSMRMTDGDVSTIESLKGTDLVDVATLVAAGCVKTVERAIEKVTNKKPPRKERAKAATSMATKLRNKPTDCRTIIESLDEIGDAITTLRQKIEATEGEFSSHQFDVGEQIKRLGMARKLLSQVRSSIKGA